MAVVGIIGLAGSLGRASLQLIALLKGALLIGLRTLVPSGGDPHDVNARSPGLRGKAVRRARCGSLLLGAALAMLFGVLVLSQTLVLLADADRRARAAALAMALSELAADYDFYVAENMDNLTAHLDSLGAAAAPLPAGHSAAFLTSGWRAPIADLGGSTAPYALAIPGFDVALGMAAADSVTGVTGVLIVSLQAGEDARLLRNLQGALDQKAAEQGRLGLNSADAAAAEVLGGALSERQFAIASPALADLEQDYVLRRARIGHEHLTQLKTDLAFVSDSLGAPTHAITAAGHVAAVNASTTEAGCLGAPHSCATEASMRFNESAPLASLNVAGALLSTGAVTAPSFKVSSALAAESLTAAGTMATSAQLALSAGASTNSLNAGRGMLTSLVAQNLQANQTSLAQGATVTPAVRADQLIARQAEFSQIITGSCVGC